MYVNDTCVLGFTHHDMVTMFQSISAGEVVQLEVCRGYPLPFDPDDPNTEIVTTVAVTSPDQNDWANELERQRSSSVAPGFGGGGAGGHPHPDLASMPDLHAAGPYGPYGPKMNRPGSADVLGQYGGGENGSEFSNELKNAAANGNPSDVMTIPITKGGMGFGFTIADSGFGQKVKKILDRARCKNLQEGDVLLDINTVSVRNMSHGEVVQVLKDCPRGQEASITIQRGLLPAGGGGGGGIGALLGGSPSKNKYKKGKDGDSGLKPKSGFLFRSKTPTAELYSTQEKEKVPKRPKTPVVDTRNMGNGGVRISKASLMAGYPTQQPQQQQGRPSVSSSDIGPAPFQRNDMARASLGVGGYNPQSAYGLADHLGGMNLQSNPSEYSRNRSPGRELDYANYQQQPPLGSGGAGGGGYPQQPNEYPGGYQPDPVFSNGYQDYSADLVGPGGGVMPSPGKMYANTPFNNGYGAGYDSQYGYSGRPQQQQQQHQQQQLYSPYRAGSLPRGRKESTSFEHSEPLPGNLTRWPRAERKPLECVELTVTLHRHDSGFGFRIVGGTEEGSQVCHTRVMLNVENTRVVPQSYSYRHTIPCFNLHLYLLFQVSIGHIVPGGAADVDGRLFSGDEIIAVDGSAVLNTSHHQVVSFMGAAAANGRVTLTVRRRIYQQGKAKLPKLPMHISETFLG